MRVLAGATVALRRIVDIVLIGLILVVVVGIVLGKGAPLIGRQSIVIGGGSMEPAVGLGSAVVIRPVDPAGLAVDDVVSMHVGPEQTTYTHRITSVVDRADGRWIQTKGDANPVPDPTLVPASAVIGRVELVIPLAGYLLALLSLPMGAMFIIGLAATLLAIAWLLESLELEPRPASRAADSDAHDALQGARSRESAPAFVELRLGAGEPIATRPAFAPSSALGAASASPAVPLFGSPLPPLSPSSVQFAGRPSVRDQINRSRETRRRRARWLHGGGHHRRALD